MSTREWQASVAYQSESGHSERTRGYGTTPEGALEHARQKPRMLATATEIGYVLSSRASPRKSTHRARLLKPMEGRSDDRR